MVYKGSPPPSPEMEAAKAWRGGWTLPRNGALWRRRGRVRRPDPFPLPWREINGDRVWRHVVNRGGNTNRAEHTNPVQACIDS